MLSRIGAASSSHRTRHAASSVSTMRRMSGVRRASSAAAAAAPAPLGGRIRPFAVHATRPIAHLVNSYPALRSRILCGLLGGIGAMDHTFWWRGYTPSENDVIAACQIKSGTNWLAQITYQIATRGDGDYAHIHDVVPWPDGVNIFPQSRRVEDLRANPLTTPTGKNVIKTHCPAEIFPQDAYAVCKFVTVFRDPKEVVASSYPFLLGSWNVNRGEGGVGIDEYVDTLFKQEGLLLKIAHHTASYWNRRHLPNHMFLNYRDIKADPKGNVSRIAELMGVELTARELDTVCEKASIGYMKGIREKFAGYGFRHELSPTIRSGKSGNAVEELGVEQCKRIDEHMRKLIQREAPDFPYDEFCNVV